LPAGCLAAKDAALVADWIWNYLKDVTSRHPNWIF